MLWIIRRKLTFSLAVYAAYLLFQLWSHSHLYSDTHNKKSKRHTVPFTPLRGKEKARDFTLSHRAGFSNMSTDSFPLSNLSPPRQPSPSPLSMSVTPLANIGAEGSSDDLPAPYTGGCLMSRETSNISGFSSTSTRIGSEEGFVNEQETTTVTKEPRVSWFLTVLLLVLVTVVCFLVLRA